MAYYAHHRLDVFLARQVRVLKRIIDTLRDNLFPLDRRSQRLVEVTVDARSLGDISVLLFLACFRSSMAGLGLPARGHNRSHQCRWPLVESLAGPAGRDSVRRRQYW